MHKELALALGAALLAFSGSPALALTGPFSGSYQVSEVQMKHLMGRVEVTVGGPKVMLSITGVPKEMETITVTQNGSTLVVEDTNDDRDIDLDDFEAKDHELIKLTVPQGTKLSIGLIGEAAIGDVGGELKLSGVHIDARVGIAKSAELKIAGSGKIVIANVGGALLGKVAGSGTIEAGSADSAELAIAGSGEIKTGDIRHGVVAKIAGSGEISVASVNGPVQADVVGSGTITIQRGRADPFRAKITGSGEVDFGGEAVNPELSAVGSGNVRLGSYSGNLRSRGPVNLTVGK